MRYTLFLTMLLVYATSVSYTAFATKTQEFSLNGGHPWLEASPATYETNIYNEFNITIIAKNFSQNDHLIGIQFEVKYDPATFKVTSITEGAFLKRWAPYGTYASYYSEDGVGRAVYGEIILPNATGEWDLTEWPTGEGYVATITFKPTFLSQIGNENLQFKISLQPLYDEIFLDRDGNWIPYATPIGSIYIYTFSYRPLPLYAEISFKAPEFPNLTTTFTWNFGDGTEITTNSTTTRHAFPEPGIYNVTLSVYVFETNVTVQTSKMVQVGVPIKVNIDGGSLYFKSETTDFYIVITDYTQGVNATQITALLYYAGNVIANLTDKITQISTGLYEVTYYVPIEAPPGTYTLLVEAQMYSISEVGLKSFLVSSTLSGFVMNITEGIATVSNDLAEVKVNLTAINAKLVNIEGNIGIINSTLGTLRTDIEKLNVTITSINGNVATISTTLGDVNVKLGDVQSIATTTLYATSILSAIAVILALAILIFVRKIIFLRKK